MNEILAQCYSHPRVSLNIPRATFEEWYASRTARDDPGRVDRGDLATVLSRYSDVDNVFVHAGLSAVASATGADPYEFLMDVLTDHFDTVMAPGFTPYFKHSRVFHREYSRPYYGTFQQLLLEDADYRTKDPIQSILVHGDLRFEECNQSHSFGENCVWEKLEDEGTLFINVGMPYYRSSHIHYVEEKNRVPYIELEDYEGIVYTGDRDAEAVTHTTNERNMYCKVSWGKLAEYLKSTGTMEEYELNGLVVRTHSAREMRADIESKLRTDEYFIVT